MIIETKWRMYARNFNRFNFATSTQCCSLEGFQLSSLSNTPSNNLCFLAKFSCQEKLYLSEMVSVLIGNSISFDHI